MKCVPIVLMGSTCCEYIKNWIIKLERVALVKSVFAKAIHYGG